MTWRKECPNIFCPIRRRCVGSIYWMTCKLKKEFTETIKFKSKIQMKSAKLKELP
ncbi:MAG: hypothetical protein WC656_01760 [Sulfurimonas sp.]|jgi:hypothetical protein